MERRKDQVKERVRTWDENVIVQSRIYSRKQEISTNVGGIGWPGWAVKIVASQWDPASWCVTDRKSTVSSSDFKIRYVWSTDMRSEQIL